MSFNKIILVGNLGKDPELRYTPAGKAVCDFSVATNEKRKDKNGEMQDLTTWFKVTAWDKMAENCAKYLEKGKQVYVDGRLNMEEWTDRENNNRYTLSVQAQNVQFLSSVTDGQQRDSMPTHTQPAERTQVEEADNESDPWDE